MAANTKEVGIFKATPNVWHWNDYITIKYGEQKPQIELEEMKKKIKIIRDVTKFRLDSNWVGKDNYSIVVNDDKAFEILKNKK